MDPNTALTEIRRAVAETDDACYACCASASLRDVLDRFEALDEWLSTGGFLPAQWADNR